MKKKEAVTFNDVVQTIHKEYNNTDIEEIKDGLKMDFVAFDLITKIMRAYLKFGINLTLNYEIKDVDDFFKRNETPLVIYERELLNIVSGQSSRMLSKVLTAKIKNLLKKKSLKVLDAVSEQYRVAIRNKTQINFFRVFNLIPSDNGKWEIRFSKKI